MSSLRSPITHVVLDDLGVPWIAGTNYRLETIVLEYIVHGWSPAEISYQHYGAVTPAQAHSAIAY